MLKLSEMERKVIAELESETLPEVAAIRLGIDLRTLHNYVSRARAKCIEAGEFLKQMQPHSKVLKLRIQVKIEAEPKRRV